MRFRRYINEMSYEEKDIPRTFRVVFEIDRYDKNEMLKNIKQLASMKFEGMTGISDKHDIGFQFLGVARDAMLIMKGKDVVKLNKLSRFLYGNPNYFLSSNMKMVRRMFQKSGSMGLGGDMNILQNILEYTFTELGKVDAKFKHDNEYTAAYQSYAHHAHKKATGISSVKDLIRWIRKTGDAVEEEEKARDWSSYERINIVKLIREMPDSKIEKAIYKAFEQMGKIFGSEGEWVVKDSTFKIPKDSFLYILVNKKQHEKMLKMKKDDPQQFKIQMAMGFGTKDAMEKWDFLMDNLKKYGIFKKYKVKFIDGNEWKQIQSKHLSRK